MYLLYYSILYLRYYPTLPPGTALRRARVTADPAGRQLAGRGRGSQVQVPLQVQDGRRGRAGQ